MKVYEIIQENHQLNEKGIWSSLGKMGVGLTSLINIFTWATGLYQPLKRYYDGIEQAEEELNNKTITETQFDTLQKKHLYVLRTDIAAFIGIKLAGWTFGTIRQFFRLLGNVPKIGGVASSVSNTLNLLNKSGQAAAVTWFNSDEGHQYIADVIMWVLIKIDVLEKYAPFIELNKIFPFIKPAIHYIKEPLQGYAGIEQNKEEPIINEPKTPESKPLGPPLASTRKLGPNDPVNYNDLPPMDRKKLLTRNILDDPSASGGQRFVIY